MTTIQFSAANGFPANTYEYLFELLAPYEIDAIPCLGHSSYGVGNGWQGVKKELLTYLENATTGKRIGIGHSLGGAATLLAASEQPDYFERIIILDPPLARANMRWFVYFSRYLGLSRFNKIAQKAKRRRTQFDSKTQAMDYFSSKKLFKTVHPRCLEAYVEYGLKPSDSGGFELTFSNKVEQAVFESMPINIGKKDLGIPAHLIYAKNSNVMDAQAVKELKKLYPSMEFIEIEGGHLFPLEQPEKTGELILKVMNE